VKALPSVYGHLVTFIAGAHACIGYRFSVVECVDLIHFFSPLATRPQRQASETVLVHSSDNHLCRIKALLFTLVRGFEFELALPAEDIVRTTAVVGRPTILSNPAAGSQLPLLIRPANMD